MRRLRTRTARLPWWLEPGEEPCETCLVLHHLELMVHCVGCDEPVCIVCVLERGEPPRSSCPVCAQELR